MFLNILVCDDEDLIRKSLARAFKSMGHQVFEAENGAVGLTMFASEKIDLVILDLLMPEKNGFDFLNEMKSLAPVVIISAFSGHQQGHFHTEEYPQVIAFVHKPFEHLQTITQQMLELYENYIRKV